MTCSNCKFQWCWLCEGEYIYGHYNQGKCKGFQFSKANNIEEARIILENENREHPTDRCCMICRSILYFICSLFLLICGIYMRMSLAFYIDNLSKK